MLFKDIKKCLFKYQPKDIKGNAYRRVLVLCSLICALIRSGRASLQRLGEEMPDEIELESRIKKAKRWLTNKWTDVDVHYIPYLRPILASLAQKGEVVLAIDGSGVGKDCMALMISAIWRGRAIPLTWLVRQAKKGHFPESMHLEVINSLAGLLEAIGLATAKITLVGDGEFDGKGLQQACLNHGWNYVVRTSKNTLIADNPEMENSSVISDLEENEGTHSIGVKSNQMKKFTSKVKMLKLENISGFSSCLLTHPFIEGLLHHLSLREEKIAEQAKKIADLEKELSKHQKVPSKPDFGGASELDKIRKGYKKGVQKNNRVGKRNKKRNLFIHKEEFVKAEQVPIGWVLVKHVPHIIQDVIVEAKNICYQLEVWRSPDGTQQMTAKLPIALQGSDFGPTLRSLILSLYHDLGSTQPCIANFFESIGVDISTGTINNLLIKKQDLFHQEKEELLEVGKRLSSELRTDDTGAKHGYKNYFTNCINTNYFTYFQTCKTKSRINFLSILRQNTTVYTLNESSLDYYDSVACPKGAYDLLKQTYLENGKQLFVDKAALTQYFHKHNIVGTTTIRIITEGLLIGTIVEDGFNTETIIHSDEAGQFALFLHCLCWKHVERPLRKLKTYTKQQQVQLEEVKNQFWQLYQQLKEYKENPEPNLVEEMRGQFDKLCEHQDGFFHLNQLLDNISKKKEKMLLVLKRPEASLHNNDSERDIRGFVKRRKVSGSTKTELGLKAKDTFLSLKKTCKKLGISFWEYLQDRINKTNKIPRLATIIKQKIDAQNRTGVGA